MAWLGGAWLGAAGLAWFGKAWLGRVWYGRLGVAARGEGWRGQAWYGRHGKGGEGMEKSAALVEKIMKRIALVEIHHRTGEWIDEKDIILRKIEDKKTA